MGVALGVGTLATLFLVLSLPCEGWQHAIACAVIVAWAWYTFHFVVLRRGPWAVTELRLAPDLVLVVHRSDGRLIAGHVRSTTYVGAWLTSIVWRPDGAYFSRAVLIIPDMLPEDDFRRLRVMLRYARSAVVQGAPLSQS